MSDFSFETRLERLFAQPPRVADADGFARRVEARLDREWSLRRGFIGAAGLFGGVVAVTQTVGAQTYAQMGAMFGPAMRRFGEGWVHDLSTRISSDVPLGGEAMWLMAAMAGLAVAFAAARWTEAL